MNSTVYYAFRCLNLLATANCPQGIRKMGRELELDSAKVTRLMRTLLALDMVQRDANRKYSLGIGIHRLSAHAIHNSAFYNAVMDLLEESGNHAISIVIGVLSVSVSSRPSFIFARVSYHGHFREHGHYRGQKYALHQKTMDLHSAEPAL